jgi:hypothetical protein
VTIISAVNLIQECWVSRLLLLKPPLPLPLGLPLLLAPPLPLFLVLLRLPLFLVPALLPPLKLLLLRAS